MKNKKVVAIVVSLVLILVGAVSFLYYFSDKPIGGEKSITIQVVMQDGAATLYEVNTDAQYLLGAMQDAEGLDFEGEDGPYGMTIYTINGVTANYNDGDAYWGFYIGDEYCAYGVAQQPIYDGDAFKIVYTPLS